MTPAPAIRVTGEGGNACLLLLRGPEEIVLPAGGAFFALERAS